MLQTVESETPGQTPIPAGVRLGPYQILHLLGQGGMGAVFEAEHVVIGRRVAIKTLSPSCSTVPGAAVQFLREAQITSFLRHPHIVDVTDVGVEEGICFLVMELLEGEDLDKRLQRGRLSMDETVEIILPVIAAVAAAHEQGIIHRDLKPHNIFLTRGAGGSPHPKVLDFGISKRVSMAGACSFSSTALGGLMGSPCYLAPEQLEQGKKSTFATDQYAIGVLLYECLAGRTPFEGEDLAQIFQGILSGTTPPLATVCPDLPPGLQQIVSRAMSVRIEDRFASVQDLGRALLFFASPRTRLNWEATFGGPEVAPRPPGWVPWARPVPRLSQGHRRRFSPWVGLAVAFATAFSTMVLGASLLPDPEPRRARAAEHAR